MHRRKFMQVVSSLCRTVPFWALTPAAFGQSSSNPNASRKILVTYAAGGGLDANTWCNPRNNQLYGRYPTVTGPTDGPIVCAPMADNSGFFARHKDKTLIFNGLDMQNSDHEGGKIALSGRRGNEFPHLCELYAASIANSSLPWITKTGHERGFELVTRSEIPKLDQFIKVFNPAGATPSGAPIDVADATNVKNARFARLKEMQTMLQNAGNGLPAQSKMLDEFIEASGLKLVANEVMPMLGKTQDTEDIDVAMWAAKLGFTNSIEVGSPRFGTYGFDGHDNLVDKYNVSLPYMTKRLDQIWKLATEFGINSRLVVYIASEMGRNAFGENNGRGKGHYSIGTATIMAEDIPGNRVIGATDAENKQMKIDFSTGRPNQILGGGDSLTHPVILQALRKYLGIAASGPSNRFPFNNAKELDITNKNIATGYPEYANPDPKAKGKGNRPAGFSY